MGDWKAVKEAGEGGVRRGAEGVSEVEEGNVKRTLMEAVVLGERVEGVCVVV